ncbi:hypothetical protein LCGC14_0769830 [marine sediment metagenome]|uniref:Uncharacterized protein n=1 Tax=marine sediment metagenome TaxID=412755 RepID=A0A0F9SIS3_9ZZZZ
MSIYICRECNYAFPNELSHLIEQNIQVYCERCGSPFSLEGVKFKTAPTPIRQKVKRVTLLSQKPTASIEKLIQFLNVISFLPFLIFSFISFGLIAEIAFNGYNWFYILIDRSSLGIISLVLLSYDRVYIYPKIKEKKYNEVFLHSLCWGIVGSVFFGLGVLILIKGVLIVIFTIFNPNNKDLRVYDYGLIIKGSLNDFSAQLGFLIIFLGIYNLYFGKVYFDVFNFNFMMLEFPFFGGFPLMGLIYMGFLLISIAALLIDFRLRSKIHKKEKLKYRDSIYLFFLGVFSCAFFAAGIFVLLKAITMFILILFKPTKTPQQRQIETKSPYNIASQRILKQQENRIFSEREPELKEIVKPTISQPELTPIPEPREIKGEEEKITLKSVKREKEKKAKELKLQLHDSLLPVKDEKDKKLVQEYFTKIFAVLSKDLRKQIIDLKIPKRERKELLEELAFLAKEEQIKYIEALVLLYKEIPKKLTSRIRKLPNVKPKHYEKIIDQLKYMDVEEQTQFVQFLEENA